MTDNKTPIAIKKTDAEKKEYISNAYDYFIERARVCKISHITANMCKESIVDQDFCFLIDNFEKEDIVELLDNLMEEDNPLYATFTQVDKDIFHTIILSMFDDIVLFLK